MHDAAGVGGQLAELHVFRLKEPETVGFLEPMQLWSVVITTRTRARRSVGITTREALKEGDRVGAVYTLVLVLVLVVSG